MRSTVIITKRGAGYISTVSGRYGGGHMGARCGLTPFEAAAKAAQYMIEYAHSNPDGGDLMAPPEVLELVPAHLRGIAASELPWCRRCERTVVPRLDQGDSLCPHCALVL